jgi:hypothetical protein
MDSIITFQTPQHNSRPTVVRNGTIHEKLPKLSDSEFKALKRKQHQAIKKAIKGLGYSHNEKATLSSIINKCNAYGVSSVAQPTLAKELEFTPKTVRAHISKFEKDGLFALRLKNGWQKSNTTIVLAVQHLNPHKEVAITPYLTPPDCGRSPGNQGERIYTDNSVVNSPIEADSVRASPTEPQESDVWEDEILPTVEELEEMKNRHMANLREMLSKAKERDGGFLWKG